MLTRVILEGEFARVAGKKEWLLDVSSPAEAIQLISVNCGGKILQWIKTHLQDYKICEVECVDENGNSEFLTTETFQTQRACKSIRFLPIFAGAGGKNSVLQAVVGVVLVVVGAILNATGWGSAIGAPMMKFGAGLILGAICTMLMTPSTDDNNEDSGTSYYFNGAVNTTRQGNPVPLIFGRCRVGSAVISASIDIKDE